MERLVIVNPEGQLALDIGEPDDIYTARERLNEQFKKALRKLWSYEDCDEKGSMYSFPSVTFNKKKQKWMFLYLDQEGIPQHKLFDDEAEARKEFMTEVNKSVIK